MCPASVETAARPGPGRIRALPAMLAALALAVAACAGGDDEQATTVPGASVSPAAGGQLTITVEGLEGASGMMLLATVVDLGAQPPAVVGTVCLPVDGDPWSGGGVVRTAAADNPCHYEPPNGVVVSGDGVFSYVVGAYTPGRNIPERCLAGEVTVSGPTELTIPGDHLVVGGCPQQ